MYICFSMCFRVLNYVFALVLYVFLYIIYTDASFFVVYRGKNNEFL